MNRLTALRTMLWAALMAASSAAVGAPPGGVPGIAPGSPAPEIAGPMLRGEPLRLSGLRGKVVLVDFWASYCGPCILAMPEINRIRTDLHAQGHAQHFEVVGVAMDRESDKAEQFLGRVSVDYPIIIDTLGLAAHSYGVWRGHHPAHLVRLWRHLRGRHSPLCRGVSGSARRPGRPLTRREGAAGRCRAAR